MFGKQALPARAAQPPRGRFNPRVRGTCLVRGRAMEALQNMMTLESFQSPCAGNMFGKFKLGPDLTGFWARIRFNPRVRGTCLVRV